MPLRLPFAEIQTPAAIAVQHIMYFMSSTHEARSVRSGEVLSRPGSVRCLSPLVAQAAILTHDVIRRSDLPHWRRAKNHIVVVVIVIATSVRVKLVQTLVAGCCWYAGACGVNKSAARAVPLGRHLLAVEATGDLSDCGTAPLPTLRTAMCDAYAGLMDNVAARVSC